MFERVGWVILNGAAALHANRTYTHKEPSPLSALDLVSVPHTADGAALPSVARRCASGRPQRRSAQGDRDVACARVARWDKLVAPPVLWRPKAG